MGTIESGPAAGVVGSGFLGGLIGKKNILATDMGGTTFKVSVIRDGVIEREHRPVILRHSILSSKIWVESILALAAAASLGSNPKRDCSKSDPMGPARNQARSATDWAVSSRRSRTPIWFWAI